MTVTATVPGTGSSTGVAHLQMAAVKQAQLKNFADENKKNQELLAKQVEALRTDNTSLQGQVQVLEAELAGRDTQLQLKEAQIRELAAKVAAFEKRVADSSARKGEVMKQMNELHASLVGLAPPPWPRGGLGFNKLHALAIAQGKPWDPEFSRHQAVQAQCTAVQKSIAEI